MTSKSTGYVLVGALAALLGPLGCSGTKTPTQTPDAGPPLCPTDPCHSSADAQMSSQCAVPLDGGITACINPSGDREWFVLPLPSPLPARPLLTVTTGMVSAPSSPVTLSLNVFTVQDGGLASVALATDPEPRGQPSNFAITIPLTGVSGDVYFLVDDDPGDDSGGMASDNRHHFALTASVTSDPDTAGHTPATATSIPLDSTGHGTGMGVLSTTGDLDYFTVDVPQMNRPILYVGIDAPAITPAPEYPVAFSIYNLAVDGGTILAEVSAPNPELEQQAATAVLLPPGSGTYTIVVNAFQPDSTEPAPPGNPNYAYTLSVIAISDLDTNEPNDTAFTATPVNLSTPGTAVSLDGRIAEVPDPDWYAVTVPASNKNTLLRYQVAYDASAANNARYPAMNFLDEGGPSVNSLELSIGTLLGDYLPDGGLQTDPALCSICPGDTAHVQAGCSGSTPQCTYSLRIEDFTDYPGLDNFLGVIPVPASSTPTQYLFLLEVQEQNASDDRAYTMTWTWEPETPNEASSYQDTLTTAPTVPMEVTGSYAEQPTGTAMTGQLAYGELGRSYMGTAAMNSEGLLPMWIQDYDAVNDTDLWLLQLPGYASINPVDGGLGYIAQFPDGGQSPGFVFADGGTIPDLSWSLAWTIPQAASQAMMSGSRPYDLFISFYFCDPNVNPTCDPVAGQWSVAALGYTPGTIESWYGDTPPQTAYDFSASAGTFAAPATQCLCLESRFVASGQIYMSVTGVDRTTYDTSTYSITTSAGPYPQSYTNAATPAAVVACPMPCQECGGDNGGCPQVTGIPTVSIP